MGTCGLVGQIGVYTGWIESGKAVTAFDWIGLVLICFVLPAVLSTIFCEVLRKKGWIKEGRSEAVSTKRLPPRGKLSPKVTDEGRLFRDCP